MKKIVILLFALVFFSSISFSLTIKSERNIKIGLLTSVEKFNIGNDNNFVIVDFAGKEYKLSEGNLNLKCKNQTLLMDKYVLSLPVKVSGKNDLIYVNKKQYQGEILIVPAKNNKVNVINVLPVEEYLKGVLPKEASASWHIESLKTQAIISRTYALSNFNKHAKEGFNLCATTHCQVYGDMSSHAQSCDKAVKETKALVLTYNDRLSQTVFHASCGGHTEDPKDVWDLSSKTPKYLRGVKCDYCKNSPHANWKQSLSENFIRERLNKSGYKVGKIKSIKVLGKTPSKTAKKLEIKHQNGTLQMNAYNFRLAVDAWKLKSTTFTSIVKSKDNFDFKGTGWGHKIGLCQWGSKGMADDGANYEEILEHYYPGIKLYKVEYSK